MCRTMLGYDRHGLGYNRQGRGNNVPNTIILPKIGIEHGICLGEREVEFRHFYYSKKVLCSLFGEENVSEYHNYLIVNCV